MSEDGKFCKCGFEIPEGAVKCRSCGADFLVEKMLEVDAQLEKSEFGLRDVRLSTPNQEKAVKANYTYFSKYGLEEVVKAFEVGDIIESFFLEEVERTL